MSAVLTQPKIRQYIHRLSDYNRFGEGKAYDEKRPVEKLHKRFWELECSYAGIQ